MAVERALVPLDDIVERPGLPSQAAIYAGLVAVHGFSLAPCSQYIRFAPPFSVAGAHPVHAFLLLDVSSAPRDT
jgi:hypothetical protein